MIKTTIPGTYKTVSKMAPAIMLKSDTIPVTTIQTVYVAHIKPFARLYDGISVISSGFTVVPDQKCIGSLRLNAQRAITPKIMELIQHTMAKIILADDITLFPFRPLKIHINDTMIRNHILFMLVNLHITILSNQPWIIHSFQSAHETWKKIISFMALHKAEVNVSA